MKTKEVKFRVTTEKHDLDTKVKHIRRWLEDGDKVKIVVQMRGREQAHPDVALKMVLRVLTLVDSHAKVTNPAKVEGRLAYAVVTPKAGAPTKTVRM